MAQKVLILGDSGTGKSASLRNFRPEEVLVINSAGKPLPFRNHFETVTPAYNNLTSDVLKAMDKTSKKVIIIDDAQYIMSFQYMRRIKENGWDKWNDIQGDFFNIIQHCDCLRPDTIVYFLSHIQRDDEGHEKLKTMGKMLDEKITLEGLFTVVLKTSVTDGQYCFITQNSGKDTVKSPIGMFDSYAIDNDLKYVDNKIRNYYEIGEFASDEAVAAMDQEAALPEVTKPERKRRAKASEEVVKVEITNDEVKLQEIKDLTDQRIKAMKGIEALNADFKADIHDQISSIAAEPVKHRRRKVRTDGEDKEEVNKETPVEEAKEEASGTATDTGTEASDVNIVRTDAPKRRRRKRTEETGSDDSMKTLSDGIELPFEL